MQTGPAQLYYQMDQDFKPLNYRRTNARFKYSRAHDQLRTRQYYHMPPLLYNPPVRINNNKKYQKEEERITEIERSNRILFQKMRNIRLKRGPYSQPSFHIKKKSMSMRVSNKTPPSIHHDFPQVLSTQHVRGRTTQRQYETLPPKPTNKRNSSVPPMRFGKNNMKLLYKQRKRIDGKTYNITAYTQNGQFWLKADEDGGHLSNYMHMNIEDYKKLEKYYLPNGIESLLNHIKIGSVIQLKGLDEEPLVEVQDGQATQRYQQQ